MTQDCFSKALDPFLWVVIIKEYDAPMPNLCGREEPKFYGTNWQIHGLIIEKARQTQE